MGAVVEKSRFGYEVESVTGTTKVELGVIESASDQLVRGQLGDGGGSLRVASHAGGLTLGSTSLIIRKRYSSKLAGELVGTLALAWFFNWIGLWWLALIILVGWTSSSFWDLYKRVRSSH